MNKIQKNQSETKGNGQKKTFSFSRRFNSIRTKLIAGFLIPVLLIIVLGVICYQISSSGFRKNYEESASSTIRTVSEYFELGFHTISSKSLQLDSTDCITEYYSGIYADDEVNDVLMQNACYNEVYSAAVLDQMVSGVYIIGNYGDNVNSYRKEDLMPDSYDAFLKSAEYQALQKDRNPEIWLGYHPFIDEKMGDISPEYGICLIRNLMDSGNKKSGFIIYDISPDFIQQMLDETNVGDGSMVGFVTDDGKELLSAHSDQEFSFVDTKFYQDAVASDAQNGNQMVTYKGAKYLFTYSKLDGYHSMTCSMIPQSVILEQSNELRAVTTAIVLIACIIAILIGTIFASGISGAIGHVNKKLDMVSNGDLTVELKSKRKDEFRNLNEGIGGMLQSMKNLIGKVAGNGKEVLHASKEVTENSSVVLTATQGITKAIKEVEIGIVQQSEDSEHCLVKMSELSDQINEVSGNAENIKHTAEDTKRIIQAGHSTVEELDEKIKDTTERMNDILESIHQLSEKSNTIGTIISTINDVADQTSLLSLNASIEAARAGEAGKGFAVVADAIRSLASQTTDAATEINRIISSIQDQTNVTVHTVEEAQSTVSMQEEALTSTVAAFRDINHHVEDLNKDLENIIGGIESMEGVKNDTLYAIENISAASEEVAATMTDLSESSNQQLGAVEVLNETAKRLGDNATHMEELIRVFKVEK